MSQDIYQDPIMALARAPERRGRLDAPDGTATVDNPLCGDRVTIDVKLDAGRIADIAHEVKGCALCQASAALIARRAIGADTAAAAEATAALAVLLKTGQPTPGAWPDLALFAPVHSHRSRHDCVSLPFAALVAAMAAAAKSGG